MAGCMEYGVHYSVFTILDCVIRKVIMHYFFASDGDKPHFSTETQLTQIWKRRPKDFKFDGCTEAIGLTSL